MEIIPIRVKATSEGKYEGKIRRASSVIDNNELSFWYTDKTLPQSLTFSFSEVNQFNTIAITFQGGFASEDVILYESQDGSNFNQVGECFYVEDTNSEQILTFNSIQASYLKLEFSKAFDMYHRLIIYSVKFYNK